MHVIYLNTKQFVKAKLHADGQLELHIDSSGNKMFSTDFETELENRFGAVEAEDIKGKFAFLLVREMAARMLVR